MSLLPVDILEKKFRRTLRGYSPREVDDFLQEVAQSMGEIIMENATLKEELEKAKEKLSYYESMEETLRNAVVLAQKTADEAIASAHQRAELILKEAELKAEEIIKSTYEEKAKMQKEIEELHLKKSSLKAQILGILNTISQLLQEGECEKES